MISEKRLAEMREFFGSGGFGPIVNDLLDEITALRKIVTAHDQRQFIKTGCWCNYSGYRCQCSDILDALKQWRNGEQSE